MFLLAGGGAGSDKPPAGPFGKPALVALGGLNLPPIEAEAEVRCRDRAPHDAELVAIAQGAATQPSGGLTKVDA